MKFMPQFVRTTLLGGVLFLMPIAMLAILIDKAMSVALKFVTPVAEKLPDEFHIGVARVSLLAIGLLVLICFASGLFARTKIAQRLVRGLESSVLSKIPAYEYFRQVTGGLLGVEGQSNHPVVLAQLDGGWQIGIQVESEINGFVTVFIPDAPNPRSGGVYLMAVERVRPAGLALPAALNCLKRYGAGTNALLQAHASEGASRSPA